MSQEANSVRDDEVPLPEMPSDDWHLNVFLTKVAKDLTNDDLKQMKYLLTGTNGTGKAVLEVIEDPLDLFQHLRQRQILTSNNIAILQAMLWHTGRKDLHKQLVKFAKGRRNLVHFYAPKDEPENGFEFIRFHIAGREKMNRHKLEELRKLVSDAVCVPLEYIIASGIEATNSILVTFMVPEGYAYVLCDLSNKDKEYLGSRGVDAIWYHGQLVSCIDVELSGEEEYLSKDQEIKSLLDQKSKLDKNVEAMQREVLLLQKKDRWYQHEIEQIAKNASFRIGAATGCLIQQHLDLKCSPNALSLKEIASQNSLKYFSHMLKKMELVGYDTDLIRHIIEANRLVVLSRHKDYHQWIQLHQQKIINELTKELEICQYERDKLKYYLKAGISKPILTQREEFFVRTLLSNANITRRQMVSVDIEGPQLTNEQIALIEKFNKLENTLNSDELSIIFEKFFPNENDRLTFIMSKRYLLHYLWMTQTREQPGLTFPEWKERILTLVKRKDLFSTWAKIWQKSFSVNNDDSCVQPTSEGTPKSTKGRNQDTRGATVVSGSKMSDPVKDVSPEIRGIQQIEALLQKNLQLTEKLVDAVSDRSKGFQHKNEPEIPFDFKQFNKTTSLWSRIVQT